MYGQLPSDMLGVDRSWWSYQFDRKVGTIGQAIENEWNREDKKHKRVHKDIRSAIRKLFPDFTGEFSMDVPTPPQHEQINNSDMMLMQLLAALGGAGEFEDAYPEESED